MSDEPGPAPPSVTRPALDRDPSVFRDELRAYLPGCDLVVRGRTWEIINVADEQTAEDALNQWAADNAITWPADPDDELRAAITGAETVAELKDALLGGTGIARVSGHHPEG